MKLGKQSGCYFNDIIDVNLSPSQLEDLVNMAEEKAMNETNYDIVGLYRTLKDLLNTRYHDWTEAREKLKKKEN